MDVKQYDYCMALFFFSQRYYEWIGRDELLGYSQNRFNDMSRTTIGSAQQKNLVAPMCAMSNNNIARSWAAHCNKTNGFSVAKLSFWIQHGQLPGYVWLEVTLFPMFEKGVFIGRKELSKWEKPTKVLLADNPTCLKTECPNYKSCQIKTNNEVIKGHGS